MRRLLETLKTIDLPHLAVLGVAVVAMVTFMYSHDVFNDGDTFWHLAAGRWIVEHGYVPRVDVLSYTMAGHEWQAHEWLADIFMWGAYSLGGWSGLVIFFGLVAAVGAGLLAMKVSKSLSGITLFCTLAMALASTSQSILIRPHALMLPVLIFWTIQIMEAREKDRAPPLALAAVMIIWANLHASYIFGFVVAGAFGLEALWEAPADKRIKVIRDWGLFGVLSLACTILTPFGIPGVIFPFKVMAFTFLNDINEWRPADFSHVTSFEVALLLCLFVCLSRGVKVKPLQALLLVTLFQMALQHRRHVIVLVLLAPLILAKPLAEALGQTPRAENPEKQPIDWRPPLFATLMMAVLISATRLISPIVRTDDRVTPIAAMQHVPKSLQAMPVLNDYSIGGYLTFIGVKPYIDGRADMYGDKFVTDYMTLIHKADPKHLQGILDKNRVAWSIFSRNDIMVGAMDRAPGFHRLYTDRWAVVHVRDDVIPPPAKPAPPPPPAEPDDED